MRLLFLSSILAGLAAAQGPNVKQSILFDGKLYILKFMDQSNVVDLNEYYLPEEGPDTWTRLLSVSIYKTQQSPGAFARRVEQGLLQTHPDAPHELVATPDNGAALLMCVNWADDRKTTSELDVYRFEKHARGVLAYQASLRPYQARITLEEYKALKDRWAQKIQSGKWPDVLTK